MNSFLELLETRQSCRGYTGQPVEHEKLLALVNAGRLAPSACNSQPWSFVVVETPEVVKEVAACGQQMGINEFMSDAGAFIIVVEEYAKLMPKLSCILNNQYFAKGDIGGAAVQVCLAAAEQGLGTCSIGMFDRVRLRELLDIPNEKQIAAYIAVGYPSDETIRDKKRKTIEEVTRFV